MKSKVPVVCFAALVGTGFIVSAGDRPAVVTTHIPVNDVLTAEYNPARRLYITDDSSYGDPRWHRVPGLKYTVMRTVFVSRDSKFSYLTQTRRVPSVTPYPVEREPMFVWSRAYGAYVPYPVDYASLEPAPQRELVGYTTLEPVGPSKESQPTYRPSPPLAASQARHREAPRVAASRSTR